MRFCRETGHRNKADALRGAIRRAVTTVGGGGKHAALEAYARLKLDFEGVLGPLAVLLVGGTPNRRILGHVRELFDPLGPETYYGLRLLQVTYCEAKDCTRLGAPFSYKLTLTGTAASTAPYSITQVTPPTIEPVKVAIGSATPALVATHDMTAPGDRSFPIVIGNSTAFVQISISDIKGKARVICDCKASNPLTDLISLTGAKCPPPMAPDLPVLTQGFDISLKGWPGLRLRPPSDDQRNSYFAEMIGKLNRDWDADAIVDFLAEMYKTLHACKLI